MNNNISFIWNFYLSWSKFALLVNLSRFITEFSLSLYKLSRRVSSIIVTHVDENWHIRSLVNINIETYFSFENIYMKFPFNIFLIFYFLSV